MKWKRRTVDEFRTVWTKGEFVPGMGYSNWIHLDKKGKMHLEMFPNDTYEVAAKNKINPKTVYGHHRFFKNRASAMALVNKYLRQYK